MARKVQKNKKLKKKKTVNKKVKTRKRAARSVAKTARDRAKYPALEKRFYSRIKQLYYDNDYAHTLPDKLKKFLNSFYEETVNARFNHKGPKIYKKKEQKRAFWRENNHRNVDMYNNLMAKNGYRDVDPQIVLDNIQSEIIDQLVGRYEEGLIEKQEDLKRQEQEMLTELEYKKLLKSGAHIPEQTKLFYNKMYPKLIEKLVDSQNSNQNATKLRKKPRN